MSLGLVGRKIGMTRVFTDDGRAVPVTVLDVANNRVTQIKTPETDGYSAVQVTYGKRRASRVSKPQAGHLAKAGVEAGEMLREFTVKRMAGQYGNVTRTTQTLKVVRVDAERGLLLVKGCVPGADGGHIIVLPSVKTPKKKG